MLALNPGQMEKSVGIEPKISRQMRRLIMMEYYHTNDRRLLKKADRTITLLMLFIGTMTPARLGDSEYATRLTQIAVRYIVQPAFYIMWSVCRLLHKDMFSDILPEDLNV